MKVRIYKDRLRIVPAPQRDIPNGLYVQLFSSANYYSDPVASTDIHKGQQVYFIDIPNKKYPVKKAWIKIQ